MRRGVGGGVGDVLGVGDGLGVGEGVGLGSGPAGPVQDVSQLEVRQSPSRTSSYLFTHAFFAVDLTDSLLGGLTMLIEPIACWHA
jgi:hypothetical protein